MAKKKYWWWGNPDDVHPRFQIEVKNMKDLFDLKRRTQIKSPVSWDQPFEIETISLKLDISDPETPFWLVEFRMHELGLNRIRSEDTFRMKIQYRSGERTGGPVKEPRVTVPSHTGQLISDGVPHMWVDGTVLCLSDHSDERTGWSAGKSTAATVASWGIQWIRAWLLWKKTGLFRNPR